LIARGPLPMPDDFTSTLLALLNEATVVRENDCQTVEMLAPRQPPAFASLELREIEPHAVENRFARTICSGMAKIRSGC
jgi:hypothetical protein